MQNFISHESSHYGINLDTYVNHVRVLNLIIDGYNRLSVKNFQNFFANNVIALIKEYASDVSGPLYGPCQ